MRIHACMMNLELADLLMTEIVVRRLVAGDLEKLPALYSNHLYHSGAYQVSLALTTPTAWADKTSKRLFVQYVLDAPLRMLGLETLVGAVAHTDSGEIVGTVIARRKHPLEKKWEVGLVVVHTNYRRSGIATRMTKFVMDQLEQKKAREVTLTVEKDTVAKGLYEKFGFKCSESLFVLYKNLQNVSHGIERTPPRMKAPTMHFKKISGISSSEDFFGFLLKKTTSTFISVLFSKIPHTETYAAIKNGKVIGYVKVDCSKFKRTGIIEEAYLQPKFHRKSLIKEMLKAILEILFAIGIEKVVFLVIKTSIDRSLLRTTLQELGLKKVREWYIMLKNFSNDEIEDARTGKM